MNTNTQKELLDIVKRNYSEIADHFAETRKKRIWPELEKIASEVPVGSKILDVGCGSGRLLDAFVDKKISYLGVDFSAELIKHAKRKAHDTLIRFAVADIRDLGKISEHEFDYVFCNAVIHHLPGKDLRCSALRQLKNKVRPKGQIIITVWNMWEQKKFRNLVWKFFLLRLFGKNNYDWGDIIFDWKTPQGHRISRRYYHAFSQNELKKTARCAGLKILKIFKDKYNYYLICQKD